MFKFSCRLVFIVILLSVASFGTVMSAPYAPIQVSKANGGYDPLDGIQIQRLFGDLRNARYPDSPIDTAFDADGSWLGHYEGAYDVYGLWHVEGDTLCLKWNGGNTRIAVLFEGCVPVYANWAEGIIAAQLPGLSKLSVIKKYAVSELASLSASDDTAKALANNSERTSPVKVKVPKEAVDTENLKRKLEEQRFEAAQDALETQRLEEGLKLSQQRLEVERKKLAQERQALALAIQQQSRGSLPEKQFSTAIEFGTYHAVVIGINDYIELPKLKTALIDARAVADVLRDDYGYKVHLLENPSRGDIIDKFDELRETLVENDNLLIYYAGHGWLDKQSGRGYWLPKDAQEVRRSRWVSNSDLTDALKGMFAKHVMVVADSCFSGTLTRSIKSPAQSRSYLEKIADLRTRVVLSSGGLEPVSDTGGGKHSVFAAQFLKALDENKGVLDGNQLFQKIRYRVLLNADQTPQYSDIRKAGHEGGDFLFVRKR